MMAQKLRWRFSVACVFLILVLGASKGTATDLEVRPSQKIANGSMQVISKTDGDSRDLIIHFHGAVNTVAEAYRRSDLTDVLVVVNFPGMSTAYSKPFANDPLLLETIMAAAGKQVDEGAAFPQRLPQQRRWRRLCLSSFSAGYGAVREILKSETSMKRVDAVIAADSIYAGINEAQGRRDVDVQNMQGFLEFAELAKQGEKAFVLSHSAQRTTYASTTETADYLLKSLGIERTAVESDSVERTPVTSSQLQQVSRATRAGLQVMGFAGDSGKEHMKHLHHIDTFWNLLPRADALKAQQP